MTFTKHFQEILERCNQNFHRLRILVNKKWGPSPETILQIYKQCVRPIFEYGIVSTITVSETVITKIQRVQNSFIKLALRLPKYVSARLLHKASGLPHVRERLISVGQTHLARMHANPQVEHTINSATTNIAWDKYKTPISILIPPDWSTDNDARCRKMRWHRPTSNHWPWKWWSGPYTDTSGTVLGLRIKSQHGYLVVVFSRCHKHPKMVDHGEVNSLSYITTDSNCLFAVAIACISKCVSK